MKHHPSSSNRNVRTFIASLLSYILLTSQLAPMAMAFNRSANRRAPAGTPDIERKQMSEAPTQGRVDGSFAPVPVPLRVTAAGMAPIIMATKVDSFLDPDMDGKVSPGQTITYDVTLTNTGPDPALNLTLNDTVDPNTTLVPGSAVSTPIAFNDAYNVVGNVRIQPNAAQGLLANDINPNTGNNTGLTASGPTTSTQGGQVAINADGSFSYNPPAGFTGTDTFTYTATSANGTDIRTVTLTVGTAGTVIWFVNASAPVGGDGRLTNPFNCYTGASSGVQTCFSDTAVDLIGDNIFLFSGGFIGGNTLLNNQKLIGQGATDTLANIAGVTVPAYSDPLPATGGASPVITTTALATTAIPLGSGNHLRGFTVGNTTGTKISGNGFGTLTVGNNTMPDVILNGSGRALGLVTGTFAATSGFTSVATTSSSAQGILLTAVAGTASFGSTTVSGSTSQGILVSTTTADINFGNTSISGGTDAVSLQNNSSGTRTLGTLSITTPSGVGFLHAVGGGTTTVTGTTTITNPTGNGIDIQNSNANISFADVNVNKDATAGTGVNIVTNPTRTITFANLGITTSNGTGLNATGGGTIRDVASNTGSINATSGPAINANGVTLVDTGAGSLRFSQANSTNSPTTGINVVSTTGGGLSIGTVSIQNPTGVGINFTGNPSPSSFGSAAVNGSGSTGVNLAANGGAMFFTNLDITPDSGQPGIVAASVGGINSTSGTISTTNAAAINVTAATALGLTFDNVSANISNVIVASGIALTSATGTLLVNAGTITGGNAAAFNVTGGSVNSTYHGAITQNTNAQSVVNVDGTTGGTIAFNTGTITGGASSTGVNINNANGNVSFANLTLGTSGSRMTNQAVTITGGTGTYSLGAVSIFTNNVSGIVATNADGTLNSASGTVDATGAAAINIDGPAGLNTLGMSLTTVNSTGSSTNGIALRDTNGTFAVTGNTAGLCGGQVTVNPVGTANGVTAPNTADCSGGTISSKTGDGVSLNNVVGVSLTRMRIQNNLNSGVFGDDLTNFSLISSFIDNNSDVANPAEANLRFNELLGTCAITNSTITGAPDDEIRMTPASGTLTNLAISGTVIGNDLAGENGNGLTLSPTTTASVTVNMTNSVVKDVFAAGVVVNGDGTTSRTFNVSNTSFLDMDGVGISMQGSFSADLSFTISNNTFLRNVSNAINVSFGTTATNDLDVLGTISGNAIGDATVDSGSRDLIGIAMESQGDADTVIFVNNNIIRHSDQQGFFAQSRLDNDADAQVGRFDLILRDNAISNIDDNTAFPVFAVNGVHVDGRNTTTLCLDSFSNDSANVGAIGDFLLRRRDTSNFILERFDDGDANFNEVITSTATIATFHNGQNDAGHNTDVLLSGTAPAGITEAPDNTCRNVPTPGNTLGPITFSASDSAGHPESQQDDFDPGYVRVVVPDELKGRIKLVPPAPRPRNVEPAPETDEIHGPGGDQHTPGAPGDGHNPGAPGEIGTPGAPAPQTDSITNRQFISSPRQQPAVQGNTAAAQVVVRPRPAPASAPAPVASLKGNGGEPTATQPVIMGNNLTWNVGTLPAGQSVTITFQVTVNTPPPTFTQVSNQGTVSADTIASVLTDDPATPAPNDPTITGVTVPPDLFVRDASVAEPASGSSPMIFTLALSTPAPAGGIVVNLSTADGSATGGTCAGGADYESVTGGTATFAVGEQIKTFPVTVCSDVTAEGDETFTLNVNSAPGAVIVDGQGTGTITANVAGTTLISELRTSGPAGAGDDFVEIYNNTDTPFTVPAGGYGLFKRGADCDALPVLVGTIPAATVIPQRGHYLFVGSTYSLTVYAGGNAVLTTDIESDFNVGLFATVDPLQVSTANRLDAVGFGFSTGGICSLLLEGATLAPAEGSTSQYSFVREFKLFNNDVPAPTDGNDNAADFTLVSTTPLTAVGQTAPTLGAPGPENLAGPNLKKYSQVGALLLDQTQPASGSRNRVRDLTVVPNGALGTLSIRRRFTNSTGAPITRLRFLIYDITTFPVPVGTADLRALTSGNVAVTGVMDAANCTANGTPATPPCTITALATTLDMPPAQAIGGGLNSSVAAGTITMGAPLANGASINLQFLFGVQQSGSFRVFVFVEAVP